MTDGSLVFRFSPRDPGIDIFMAPGQLDPPLRVFDTNNQLISSLPITSLSGNVTLTPGIIGRNTIRPTVDGVEAISFQRHSAAMSQPFWQTLNELGGQLSFLNGDGSLVIQPSGGNNVILQVIDPDQGFDLFDVYKSSAPQNRTVFIQASVDASSVLTVRGNSATQSGNLLTVDRNTGQNMFTIPPTGLWSQTIIDGATSVESAGLIVTHKSTGIPAIGFGTQIQFGGDSSTNTNRRMGTLGVEWLTPTDGITVSKLVLQAASGNSFVPVLTGDGTQLVIAPGSFQIGSSAATSNELFFLTSIPTFSTTTFAARVNFTPSPTVAPGAGTAYRGFNLQALTPVGLATDLTNASLLGGQFQVAHQGTGALGGGLIGFNALAQNLNTGTVAEVRCIGAQMSLSGGGVATIGSGMRIRPPIVSGGSTSPLTAGLWIDNQGNAGITNSSGILVLPQSGSATTFALQIEGGLSLFQTGADGTTAIAVRANSGTQSADLMQWQNSVATKLLSVAAGGHLTFAEGVNLIGGTVTGTQIGTSTNQKFGFWGVTPVVQQANASSGGVSGIAAGAVYAQADMVAVKAALTAIRAGLAANGVLANTA